MHTALNIPEILILVLEKLSFHDITSSGFVCRKWKDLALEWRWSISWVPVRAALWQLAPLKAEPIFPIWHLDTTEKDISREKWEQWIQTTHRVKRLTLKKFVLTLASVNLLHRLANKFDILHPWLNLQSADIIWNLLLLVPAKLPSTIPDTQSFESAMLLGQSRTTIRHVVLEVDAIILASDTRNYQLVFSSVKPDAFTQLDTVTLVTPFPDIQSAIFSGCPTLRRLELTVKECRGRLHHIESVSVFPSLKELRMSLPEGGLAIDVLDSCRVPGIKSVSVTCPSVHESLREKITKRVREQNEEAITVFTREAMDRRELFLARYTPRMYLDIPV